MPVATHASSAKKTAQQRKLIEKELPAVEGRLARDFDAFESGDMLRDIAAERVRAPSKPKATRR